MIKVLTWLWHQPGGRTSYTDAHVRIWAAMVRRHLCRPHRLAVVTDIPGSYGADVEVIPPPRDFLDVKLPAWGPDRPQCLRRLSLFRPDAPDLFGAERIVCMDLDVAICDALDPLFAGDEDFRIAAGTAANRPYNGSIFMLRLGSRTKVFTEFDPQTAATASRRFIGSDQAWLAHALKGEKVWTPADGVVWWELRREAKSPRLFIFPGIMKPWRLADVGHVDARHYRGEGSGKCLILGHAQTVWDEVARVLPDQFDAVIASPEAAVHLSDRPVLAIAEDDDHAERLAAMHGFKDVVFCGRSERMAT